jgi:hypothetical protein
MDSGGRAKTTRSPGAPDTRRGTGRVCQFPDEIAAMPRFLCFLFFVLQAG